MDDYKAEIVVQKRAILDRLRKGDKDFYSRHHDFKFVIDDEPFLQLQAEGKIRWNYDTIELE